MENKKTIIIIGTVILILGVVFVMARPQKECRTDLILSNEPEWTETCYDYNIFSRAFNQLLHSGDIRCGSKKWCGWYNKQASIGIIVDECEEITKEDFCYYSERKMTSTQIEIKARALKKVTFSCNYNLNPDWCDYEIRECDAWRIGLFNWQICPPNMNLEDCGEHFDVIICENGGGGNSSHA